MYLNTRGINGDRNRIISYTIIKVTFQEIDPEGLICRWHELKATRGEFIVPGPNFV